MNLSLTPERSYSESFGQESPTSVSRYDLVSGFLIAAVGLVGFVTGLMALLVFLNTEWNQSIGAPIFIFEDISGLDNPEGVAEDFKEPGVEELADVDEPQLADALEMVTNALSTKLASLEAIDGNAVVIGRSTGLGDRRKVGLGPDGTDKKTNPAQHWIVKYSSSSKESYAAQLDYFKIEIGSLSKETSLIEYAHSVSDAKPKYKKGTRKEEKRIYFKKPSEHPVLRWDKEFLKSAGAETKDRYILTFYPLETINKLKELEQQALTRDKKKAEDVKRTVFTVEAAEQGGYQFKLSSIKYN